MANLNKVMLIGRLTRDPEVRMFANGGKVAHFGFAVNNRRKNTQTGQWEDEPVSSKGGGPRSGGPANRCSRRVSAARRPDRGTGFQTAPGLNKNSGRAASIRALCPGYGRIAICRPPLVPRFDIRTVS